MEKGTEKNEFEALLGQLLERLAAVEAENRHLAGKLDQLEWHGLHSAPARAPMEDRIEPIPLSRRVLRRLGGAWRAGLAAAKRAFAATPVYAASGDFVVLGAYNDSGTDTTMIESSSIDWTTGTPTVQIAHRGFYGGCLSLDAPAGAQCVDVTGKLNVFAEMDWLGLGAVVGYNLWTGAGVVGVGALGGPGVFGFATYESGLGAGVLGGTNGSGNAVCGEIRWNPSNTNPAVQGSHWGGGAGVSGHVLNDQSDAPGVWGRTDGSGPGVLGDSTLGPGVVGQSESGPGVQGQGPTGGVGVNGVAGSNAVNPSGIGYGVLGTAYGGSVNFPSSFSFLAAGVVGSSGADGREVFGPGVIGVSDFDTGVYGITGGQSRVVDSAFHAVSVPHSGVIGDTNDINRCGVVGLNSGGGAGVFGRTTTGDALLGQGNVTGVHGTSDGGGTSNGQGVFGEHTNGGWGVIGRSAGVGVRAENTASGPALSAVSASGHGAELSGSVAQLQLVPNPTTGHPATGQPGELIVDTSGALFYCRGGSNWVTLA
jgi:hypothetical protein